MSDSEKKSKPPKFYEQMREEHPDLITAYEALGEAAKHAGPLDAKVASLAKLGIALGAGLEGATHSAVRKALDAGCDPNEIRHVALLATTTLGFPTMMRGRAWIEDVLRRR